MAVANALLWQKIVSIRIRLLVVLRCVSRVPVEHQVGRSNRSKHLGSFCGSCGIAARLIFKDQNYTFLTRLFPGVTQFFIHSPAIWCLRIDAPKIAESAP